MALGLDRAAARCSSRTKCARSGASSGCREAIVERQPFPGPGLAVRVIGEVDRGARSTSCARRMRSSPSEIEAATELAPRPWQYFAVLTPVRSVGVMGDGRTYANLVGVRAITSRRRDDRRLGAPAARAARAHLAPASSTRCPGVNRVAYDITSQTARHGGVGIGRMRILVVGSGAREDALSWRLARSASCDALCTLPGTPGPHRAARTSTSRRPTCASGRRARANGRRSTRGHRPGDVARGRRRRQAARRRHRGVRPEPFGRAARDEQDLRQALHGTPRDPDGALRGRPHAGSSAYEPRRLAGGVVVKADGLAAGKGVVVCDDATRRAPCVAEWYGKNAVPGGGSDVVLEERMNGREISVFAIARRARDGADCGGVRLQARGRRRYRPEHRRDGRILAAGRVSRRRAGRRARADRRAGAARSAGRRRSVSRRAVLRADVDGRRSAASSSSTRASAIRRRKC